MIKSLPVISASLARWLGARRPRDRATIVPHGDGAVPDTEALRASESMGLDVAPSMVFLDRMPPYSLAIDRPMGRHA